VVLAGVAATLLAGEMLTRPVRVAVGAPPADLQASDASFVSPATGRRIGAWFAAGEPGAGAVLLLHPLRADRRAMLERARLLRRAGHAVLLADLQAHGESDGERIAFGAREARDVGAMLDALARLAPGERQAAIGWSLGGAAIVLSGEGTRLTGLVLEAVYPTIEAALDNRMRLHLGPPGPLLSPLLLLQLAPRIGVAPAALAPIARMPSLCTPVLIVNGSEDRHTTRADALRLFAAAREPKALLIVEGAAHVDLHRHAPARYEAEIGAFLATHLRATSRRARPDLPCGSSPD
jgi:uncharacterized protein